MATEWSRRQLYAIPQVKACTLGSGGQVRWGTLRRAEWLERADFYLVDMFYIYKDGDRDRDGDHQGGSFHMIMQVPTLARTG